ncbi:MAG: alpha/beta fold hydrolase [Zoogloeaceae bacterium]|nr:alpha/beta fold hydrolase [Zoogloeaceae bacterium]
MNTPQPRLAASAENPRFLPSLILTVAACAFLAAGCDDSSPRVAQSGFPAPGTPEQAAAAADEGATDLQHPSEHLRVTSYPGGFTAADVATWREEVPEIEEIEIPSSADGASQRALFHDSGSDTEKPLLLVLHSWSADYQQNIDIPLAQFAVANDWVFMHPDFRGQNDGHPESTASDLAISDMEDALEYARNNAKVDDSRVYLLGYSGGAMNALHLAARHPAEFAGIAAWVPVYDLPSWHQWNDERGEKYAGEIADACGGVPQEGTPAHEECVKRSPSAHVSDVAGELRILIAHGINDENVPPDHALHAFNDLADEADRIAPEHIQHVLDEREIPEELLARSTHGEHDFPHFAEADAEVLLHLRSGPAELVLFDGEHDMLYRPGLEWLALQQQ